MSSPKIVLITGSSNVFLPSYPDLPEPSPTPRIYQKGPSNTISGGNNGIGYATVQALLESKRSYHVLMGSRSLEKAAAAIESLKRECPGVSNTVEVVQVDITSDESIEKAFETVSAKFDHIDVLINNAGISIPLSHHTSFFSSPVVLSLQ
jgi:NAD(P)-dependent dehydrogenase (short-subunit alcohol dehydrogenase family)